MQLNPFKYSPNQKVKVIAFDVNYRGRILRCIWDGPGLRIYQVEYVDDKGDFQNREFLEDELTG